MKPDITCEKALSIVKNIIYEVNGITPDKIGIDDRLIKDLAMDSVEMIDFLMKLEEIDVIVSESQLTNALTVRHVVQLVKKRRFLNST